MARAVLDCMKYGMKASTVFTESLQHNFKAVNGTGRPFTQQLGNKIIFELPGMGKGYYCDFTASYFCFRINVGFTTVPVAANDARSKVHLGYLCFDRGPEFCSGEFKFMIPRVIYLRTMRITMICIVLPNS